MVITEGDRNTPVDYDAAVVNLVIGASGGRCANGERLFCFVENYELFLLKHTPSIEEDIIMKFT